MGDRFIFPYITIEVISKYNGNAQNLQRDFLYFSRIINVKSDVQLYVLRNKEI